VYFGKDAKDLTIGQASLLAGLPQAPSLYDPYTNYQGAKDRQLYVLGQMVRDGYIKQSDADASIAEDLRPQLKAGKVDAATGPAPHFVEYVLGQLDAQYGADQIRAGGVQVTTTIDLDVQHAADTAIRDGVGKLGHGVNNAAMLVTDPKTGQILAMVGSADFNNVGIAGQVNITNTGRQPGSSFKPYVYLAGLNNHKLDTTTVLKDAPGAVPGTLHDFDNRFLGTMRMRTALVKSRNVPAEQAMMISGPTDVVDMAHKVGIRTALEPNLATAIGGLHTGITMIDHATGYGVLATEGVKHDSVSVLKIQASDGRDITIPPPSGQESARARPHLHRRRHSQGLQQGVEPGFRPSAGGQVRDHQHRFQHRGRLADELQPGRRDRDLGRPHQQQPDRGQCHPGLLWRQPRHPDRRPLPEAAARTLEGRLQQARRHQHRQLRQLRSERRRPRPGLHPPGLHTQLHPAVAVADESRQPGPDREPLTEPKAVGPPVADHRLPKPDPIREG